MKTAISLPDDLFDQAEVLAQYLQLSRNELYSRALSEYLARHAPDQVTEALDRVVDEFPTTTDDFVSRAARRVLERNEW